MEIVYVTAGTSGCGVGSGDGLPSPADSFEHDIELAAIRNIEIYLIINIIIEDFE
jgi:hypothetical protein